MNRIAQAWRWLRTQSRERSVELRLGLRVSIAAMLSFAVSHWLHLPLSLWTVLTAVVLTQMNVGRSMKATADFMVGTLGGAIYSGAIAVLVPHSNELALLAVLAIGIGPLAMLAASDQRFSAAPFTAVLVLLAPTIVDMSPVESAMYRIVEVTLGAFIGLAVSLLLLPARAQFLAVEVAARMLELMARLMPVLFKGFAQELAPSEIRRIEDAIGGAFAQLDAVAAEAQRERLTSIVPAPDPGPLRRTLLRMRHDLVMIGRAAEAPLPEPVRMRLAPLLARLAEATATYWRESSAALVSGHDPPPLHPFESALESYLAEIAEIRRLGLTRDLPVEAVERIFALGFALEQLHENLGDLARVVKEFAQSSRAGALAKRPEPDPAEVKPVRSP